MNRYMLVVRLGVALLLILALGDRTPTYYSLLRVTTAFAAVEAMWLAILQRRPPWVLAFGFVTVLWNPVWPLRMPEQAWQVLDLTAAALFTLSVVLLHSGQLLAKGAWRPSRSLVFGVAFAGAIVTGLAYLVTSHLRVIRQPQVLQRASKPDPLLTAFFDDGSTVKQKAQTSFFESLTAVEQKALRQARQRHDLETNYETLIQVRGGRIARTDYLGLSPIVRDLLEIRLQKALLTGDPVAQQALRDIESWKKALLASSPGK